MKFDFPCGFSKCVIGILHPATPIDSTMQKSSESIMKTNLRIIDVPQLNDPVVAIRAWVNIEELM